MQNYEDVITLALKLCSCINIVVSWVVNVNSVKWYFRAHKDLLELA